MIDAEVFGGVVTNIEKLLTPKQRKKFERVQKARNHDSAQSHIIKRVEATPVRHRVETSAQLYQAFEEGERPGGQILNQNRPNW